MSLWGNLDAANNAPKHGDTAGYGGNTPQVTGNTQVYYANTAINDFISSASIGVFGVDASEQATASAVTGQPAHAGWVIRKVGTGPVVSITANSGAVAVNSYITFSQGNGSDGSGSTAANAQISVNTAGYITSITLNSGGSYANTPIASPNTGNAVFTVTMGGRANRVQSETIVAMGSIYGDGDTLL
tara:strand:+ start:4790 stop:5350 length:561 start_codon:yes stop_codon:yes gene_type:complete